MKGVLKDHVFKHEAVVVGSSLPALFFAWKHQMPVFAGKLEAPFEFDFFEGPFLGFSGETLLKTNIGEIKRGPQKLLVWNHLFFELSLGGLIPLGSNSESVLLDIEKRRVSAVTAWMNREAVCEFERAYVFDPELLEPEVERTKLTRDWMQVANLFFSEDYDVIFPDHMPGFNEILLYLSPRRAFQGKDAICVFEGSEHSLQETKFLFWRAVEPFLRPEKNSSKPQPQMRDVAWKMEHKNRMFEMGNGCFGMDFDCVEALEVGV